MTGQENERLAVVETQVTTILTDVAEIKKQVVAIRTIVDRRGGFGDAVRTGLPLVISLGALAAAVLVR